MNLNMTQRMPGTLCHVEAPKASTWCMTASVNTQGGPTHTGSSGWGCVHTQGGSLTCNTGQHAWKHRLGTARARGGWDRK